MTSPDLRARSVGAAAVIGPTAWGTTLAILLARNGVPTTLLARTHAEAEALRAAGENRRRLPGHPFPATLIVSSDPAVLQSADLIVFAVPAQTAEHAVHALAAHISSSATVMSAMKGIQTGTGRRMTEVLGALLPGRSTAALSGPNLSDEVARGLPGTTVIASRDADLEALQSAFHTSAFRVYTSTDVVGVELGGALKNVVAIAAGIVDALGYGDNAKAAVMTRGLAEMARLGVAAGADPITFQGLAGMGDLIATSYSPLSRNRRLGELLGRGATLDEALATIGSTAEGATTIPAALALAARLGVELPIAAGLQRVLYEGLSPTVAAEALLGRDPKAEWPRSDAATLGQTPARI